MRPSPYAPLLASLAFVGQAGGPALVAEFPNGRVEARGACEITPDRVGCWNMDGSPAPALAEAARAALGNGSEASFRLGKKNRYLVVRHPQALQVSYRLGPNDNIYQNFSTNDDPRTEFLKDSAETSDASAVLHLQTTVQAKDDVVLPLREGARATIEGWNVEVGAVRRVPPKNVPRGGSSPYESRRYGGPSIPPEVGSWTIVFGLSGPEGQYANWAYVPVDASGDPILYVDAAGRPITPVRALALEPTLASGSRSYSGGDEGLARRPKAMAAVFQAGNTGPAFRAVTNVDPRSISALRIRASHEGSADLGPFPLDPK